LNPSGTETGHGEDNVKTAAITVIVRETDFTTGMETKRMCWFAIMKKSKKH
jgi:hypothetical protein